MLFIFLMSFLFLDTNNPKYYSATTKSMEAVYEGSDVKGYVITAEDKIREKQPLLSKAAPIGYGIFYKKNVSFKTDKIAMNCDLRTKASSVSYTWHW